MTIGEWLATRVPAPPPTLMTSIRQLLGDAANEDARYVSARCLAVAEVAVTRLLREGRVGRESATELLAADALVTFAFEGAADDPDQAVDLARGAMARLARIGAIEVGSAGRTDERDRPGS
jgi:hypothetical protein